MDIVVTQRTRSDPAGFRVSVLLALVIAFAGCGDSTGPATGDGGRVALMVGLDVAAGQAAHAPVSASVGARDLQFTDGSNTLDITRAVLVLRELELELEDDDSCDDDSGSDDDGSGDNDSSSDDDGHDDDCEEFEVGPMLLELPLDGGVATVIAIDGVPAGVYDEVEFEIHKPDDDTPEDLAFIQAHPEFRRVSVRVEGRFNGSGFTYLSDLNEDQEIELDPPLVVSDGATTNVTLTLDLDGWFRAGSGQLIDPTTANDGGPNEDLVEDNIEDSIEGFEDRDSDGRR